MRFIFILCALFASSPADAAPSEHVVDMLPGWHHPLPSKTYSGYVDAGSSCQNGVCFDMHEHYVFIESENSPSSDPLVLWTNGGPGAASLYGLFVELGPFYLSDKSLSTEGFNKSGVPTLFRNEYSWSKFSNLLIINSPPPVGFSYCDPAGPAGDGYSCGAWNDTRTAEHNLIFIKNWFKLFPEFQSNKFYLTGESYAGIYVPTLAREILQDKSKESSKINLAGWAVGDACMGTEVHFYSSFCRSD
jgi:serine carboxypeptidase-like clade 1